MPPRKSIERTVSVSFALSLRMFVFFCAFYYNASSHLPVSSPRFLCALFLITALIKLKTHFFPFGTWNASVARYASNYVYISNYATATTALTRTHISNVRSNATATQRKTPQRRCDFLNVVAMSSRLPFLDGLCI